jgi:hypothetical protein
MRGYNYACEKFAKFLKNDIIRKNEDHISLGGTAVDTGILFISDICHTRLHIYLTGL